MPTHLYADEALVIGCGVSGLACGIRLLEAGFPVLIRARELPPATTSNVAGAIWYPYKAYPVERVLPWSKRTLDELCALAGDPAAGVDLVELTEVFDQPVADPWWRDAVRSFRRAAGADLPPHGRDGYVVAAPMIDTPVHMRYLVGRFLGLGGRIEQAEVASLAGLADGRRLIVNCSGVGAGRLADDPAVFPIRGQIVLVRPAGPLRHVIDDTRGIAYILPRRAECVLGGTADEGDWSLEPDPASAAAILARCAAINPALAGAEILGHAVGLRPGRPAVRLELERLTGSCAVIHNYGHGGAGFTLAWGCADEVAALARGWIGGAPEGRP